MCTPQVWSNVVNFAKVVGNAVKTVAQNVNKWVGSNGGWLSVGTKAAQVVVPVAQTAVQINSAKQAAKSQAEQNAYEARMAQENAKIAEQNAAMERQQGIEEARLQRIKVAQAIGSQKTAMAANGVDLTGGTALDVIEDTAAMGELDALQTRYNYERKALAYEAQGYNYQNQANLEMIEAQNAYSAGKYNALSAGLAGIGNTLDVASKWYSSTGNTTNSSNKSTGLKIKTKVNKGMKNQMAMNTVI